MAKLKNNQGRFQISGMDYDDMATIVKALDVYESFLVEMLEHSTPGKNYYVEWSICRNLKLEFNKKVSNNLALPSTFGKTVQLHELFVLQESLLIFEPSSENAYQESVCRKLIMLINPALPRMAIAQIESRL